MERIENYYALHADFHYYGELDVNYFVIKRNLWQKGIMQDICISSTSYNSTSGVNAPIKIGSNRFMVIRKLGRISIGDELPSFLIGVILSEVNEDKELIFLFPKK